MTLLLPEVPVTTIVRPFGDAVRQSERAILGLSARIWALTACPFLAYLVILGSMTVQHVQRGWGSLLDLGIFDEIAWNTAHGRLYWDTIDPVARHSFLGQHTSPALILTGLLYALVPFGGPLRLVVFQTVLCGVSVLPLAWLGGRLLHPWAAPLIAIIYLLYPPLQYANLFDFHEIALAVPALALACVSLHQQYWRLLMISLLFAMLCKEDMTLVVASFGLYLVITQRDGPRWLGVALLVVAVIWALLVLKVVVPYYRGAPYTFGQRYAGGLLSSATSGGRIQLSYLWSWWTPGKGTYLLALLGPWLGLPLLAGWRSIVCLAPLATSLLATFPNQYDYHNQYAAPFAPLGMACAVWAIGGLRQRFGHGIGAIILSGTLIATLAAALLIGPLPGEHTYNAASYGQSATAEQVHPLISMVPAQASVSTVNRFGAYLSERQWIWHFPRGVGSVDYILLMQNDTNSWDYQARALAALAHDPLYRLIARHSHILLYRRRSLKGR